jgi:curved DNA-binding protein CbpA
MKTFDDQNYYEILKLPFDADGSAIQRAYREALEIYGDNSLVTYALFSDEQRADLLQAIDEAFHTLMDESKRATYNQMLVRSGLADASAFARKIEKPPTYAPASPAPIKHRDLSAWVKQRSKEEEIKQLSSEILGKDRVSGDDLKRMREALGIEIAEIYELTRISATTLKAIESNQSDALPAEVFLKSFLRSLAQILQMDSQRVVEGYLKYLSLAKRPAKK